MEIRFARSLAAAALISAAASACSLEAIDQPPSRPIAAIIVAPPRPPAGALFGVRALPQLAAPRAAPTPVQLAVPPRDPAAYRPAMANPGGVDGARPTRAR